MPEEKIAKCHYPNCKSDAKMIWRMEIGNEENTLNERALVDLPFCVYHFHIVCGGRFTCNMIVTEGKDEPDFVLKGPFDEIQLIEQVIAAREVAKDIATGEKEQEFK